MEGEGDVVGGKYWFVGVEGEVAIVGGEFGVVGGDGEDDDVE